MQPATPARLLIVAGHEPSGGAGIDADREAVEDPGLERETAGGPELDPAFVVTAWTDQDDRAVRSIGARDPREWLAEALAIAREPIAAVTPGLPARLEAARILLALGAAAVVIKGGHGEEDPVRDLVARPGGRHAWIERARVRGGGIRGSGCRFASRLAALLALGKPLEASAEEAG